jgi:hypothetical protein
MEPRQLDARKAAELAAGLHNLDRRTEASIDAVADRLRSTLAALTRDHAVQSELRSIDGVASTIVPQYARYADLCILGMDAPEGPASVNYTFSEQLLFVTGRTVLFIPPEASCSRKRTRSAPTCSSPAPLAIRGCGKRCLAASRRILLRA